MGFKAALAPRESTRVARRETAKKTRASLLREGRTRLEDEIASPSGVAAFRSFPQISAFPPDKTIAGAHMSVLRKLTNGSNNDPFEIEADRVASEMMTARPPGSEPESQAHTAKCTCGGTCSKCRTNHGRSLIEAPKTETLHHPSGAATALTPAQVPEAQKVLAAPGRPLEPGLRGFMEERLGFDLGKVRIHADERAAESADELHARAYAAGSHLVFARGQYAPSTWQGKTLLGHELTHVAQQGAGMPAIQRQPATAKPLNLDVNAARYRGKAMAARIRKHGKLSKEARAKIDSELAFFQGPAKDAYLAQVKPALFAVTETEMPTDYVPVNLPKPISLMESFDGPYACGGQKCFTDEELNAPRIAAENEDRKREDDERQKMLDDLKGRMQGWRPADQAFALQYLDSVLHARLRADPRSVSDHIREPLLSRLRKELEDTDKARAAACAKDDRGFIEKIQDKFNNDDLCKSWFENESSHGPNTLLELERQLKIERGAGETAVDQVYWDVFQYRKLSDPAMLEQEALAGAMVNAFVGVAGVVGDNFSGPKTAPGIEVAPGGGQAPDVAPIRPAGPDPTPIQGGGAGATPRQGKFSVVDPDNTLRPVSPGKPPSSPPSPPTNTPAGPAAANDNAAQQAQAKPLRRVAGGGVATDDPSQPQMAVRPKRPSPDFEHNRSNPSSKDVLQGPQTTSDAVDDLDRVSQSEEKVKKSRSKNKKPGPLNEKQQIIKAGNEIEASNVQEWARKQPASASVYTNAEFPPDVKSIYPKVKGKATSGPDAISVLPGKGGAGEITVFDTTTKPTSEHVAKTRGDAQKLKNNLPERWKGYSVYYQEGWSDGGLQFSPRKRL